MTTKKYHFGFSRINVRYFIGQKGVRDIRWNARGKISSKCRVCKQCTQKVRLSDGRTLCYYKHLGDDKKTHKTKLLFFRSIDKINLLNLWGNTYFWGGPISQVQYLLQCAIFHVWYIIALINQMKWNKAIKLILWNGQNLVYSKVKSGQ